jgi:hypothetical protein
LAVRSHGSYGDIGGFTLTVSIPSSGLYYNPGTIGMFYTTTTAEPKPSATVPTSTMTLTTKRSGGVGMEQVPTTQTSPVVATKTATAKKTSKKSEEESRDEIFETWPTELHRMQLV